MHLGWLSPPTRREITLVLFSLSIFIFAYNLDVTLSPHNAVFRRLGLSSTSVISQDGRRPPGWRDRLEDIIFGDWPWDEGHVSGDGAERAMRKGSNRYGAQWMGKNETGPVHGEDIASDVLNRWGDQVPTTTLIKHVPGYTILDGLILFNHSAYLITDDPAPFPPISSIVSPQGINLEILSTDQAALVLGNYGGKIIGVTFISNDAIPHNSTLISLWRTYSSLDPSIDAFGRTILQPPRRLLFPKIPVFSDPRPDPDDTDFVRTRSLTGFHPYLAKAAFPSLGIMYQADWDGYQSMEVPFIFERVVISDRRAAATESDLIPALAPPFESIGASEYWFEPIRRTLMMHLNLEEEIGKKGKKKVVTYLSTQDESSGPNLREADHNALIRALQKMGRRYGYEINVVSSTTPWNERMTAIVKSTVVLGVHGMHLVDFVFMQPSSHTTLFEIFPYGTFRRDNQILAHAVGSLHLVWWNDRPYSGTASPGPHDPTDNGEVVVDPQAVVDAIRDLLRQ